MRLSDGLGRAEDGAQLAARQAALLFALSGVLALAAIPSDPDHAGRLTLIGLADLVTAVLAVPAFAVLGLSTWAFGGFAAGTGPFFVLIFAWLGLHHRRWVILACILPATVAYLAPLIAVSSPPRVLSSALVLIPVAVGSGLVIAHRVRYLREEPDRA